MYRNKKDLLEKLLEKSEKKDQPGPDSQALIRAVQEKQPVVEVLEEVKRLVPDVSDKELEEYYQFALMGVSQAFVERHLSPFLEEHLDIIPPLLEDIGAVYGELKIINAEFDREEFRFRAFDYGIHKAYYLDWRLYMSKEMY